MAEPKPLQADGQAEMHMNTITISGNKSRATLFALLAGYVGILIVQTLFMQKPRIDSLPFLIGWTIGTLFVKQTSYLERYNIIIGSDSVEGPQRFHLLVRRRTVSLSDIDLSRSKRPSILKGGYLALRNGGRIILHGVYFTKSDIDTVFEGIEERLTDAQQTRSLN